MIRSVVLATAFAAILSGPGVTADPSPLPTTSPTTSGKLNLSKAELARFGDTRSSIRDNIAKFSKVVKSGRKSEKYIQELQGLAAEITKQAAEYQRYSKLANNPKAEKIASQLILDDDVGGRQSLHQATAKRLMELASQLALLAPVVNR